MFLATSAACGSDAPQPAADSALPAPESTVVAPVAPTAEDAAARLAAAQAAGPEAVVRLLLEWDTAGLRYEAPFTDLLAGVYCFQPEQQCLNDEPYYDFAIVVTGYQLDPAFVGPDSAQFVALFDELGMAWPDALQDPPGSPPETLTVKLMAGRWRLVGTGSQFPPHLSPNGLLHRYRGIQPDSAVIARWLEDRAEQQ
jgi:hypothetical protein